MAERSTDRRLTRRRLLQAGAGALAALACRPPRRPASSSPGATGPAFRQPPGLRSDGGVLEATLRAARTEVRIGGTVEDEAGGRPAVARTYNGELPGPTLRVRPGDRLDLRLVNELAPPATGAQPPCAGAWEGREDRPHGFDTTNLHTHGLHVSPQSLYAGGSTEPATPGELPRLASDDVLLAVAAGRHQDYRIWLPRFHAPGTHWYHAHKHGSAALQVASGMAGALIVEEPPEARLVGAEADRVWVIHEAIGDNGWQMYTRNPPLPDFLINGVRRPRLTLRPRTLERWRFVNAAGSLGGSCRLRLLDSLDRPQPLHLMAVDGITFYGKPPQARLDWLLPPGGRADFLLRLERPGRYRVVKDQVEGGPKTFRQDLAYVEVAGRPAADALPARLPGERPAYLEPIVSAEAKGETVRFGIRRETADAGPGGPCGLIPNRFEINGATYRRDRVDHEIELGAVEEWELTNSSAMLHVFHVHVNPFQVLDGPDHLIDPAQPDEPGNRIWRDTVVVPPARGGEPGRVRIRSRFVDYAGRFVLHCHILVHEDLGMMQNVYVRGEGAPPCAPLLEPLPAAATRAAGG